MMDVIEISSDSDSDCVVSPQPPFKKRRTTFYREQMKEARGKNRDEATLPRKSKKTAVEESQEDRTADKERQPGEGKHTRRQQPQATRGGSNDAIVVPSGPAVEEGEQRQRPLDVRNEAFVDSPHVPFPITVPAPIAAPVVAVAIPAAPSSAAPSSAASPRFRADKGTQPLPVLPIAAEKPSLPDTIASAEKPTPTGSDREPHLPASAVANSSDPLTLQKSPSQASLHKSRCLQQQHTRPGNTAPALPASLQAVMAHLGRVWRRPGQLFQRQADDDATR
ncbi:hypothetical protein MY8738_003995 [Beauveria namnaoensis]